MKLRQTVAWVTFLTGQGEARVKIPLFSCKSMKSGGNSGL
ncbi:hypothetical protein DT23_03950 [Thioclava indica]|uniref:Uncharacterized protein n=1 Tax=Thioclava indica TaxID=1353528 RepID=A0A074KCG1_9RHOB|nr:hypothetical protein DT23_03950 [Thioclava indica]